MNVNKENIPALIQAMPCWVAWKREEVEGRSTKIPYSVHGGRASTTNPATWGSYEEAMQLYEAGGYEGVGICVSDGMGAIDIDDCVRDGVMSPPAVDIVGRMNSYTEYSPSGNGIRILFLAKDFKYDSVRYYLKNPHNKVEIYIAGSTARYVTITGNTLADLPVEERGAEVAEVLESHMVRPNFKDRPKPSVSPQRGGPATTQSAAEVIERIRKSKQAALFDRLMAGDTSGHNNDASAADLALCNLLAFYTKKDAVLMDEIFRTSQLCRDKWDSARGATTYGEMTIERAIRDCTGVYTAAEDFDGLIVHEAKPTIPTEPTIPTVDADTPKLEISTATDLMNKEFPPLIQAVDQLICEGLTMLVAASKIGKSWLVLLMAVCAAQGKPFLGRATTRCRVVYFALEDSERRLQCRLRTMGITEAPENLSFVTKAQMLDTGFVRQVENWLAAEEGPALVIVDTLQKVRGIAKKGVNTYEGDYDVVGSIKALADKYRAMIVCVHHTNKAKNVTDIFDKVSGSMGIMGAADTTILIDRERGQDVATVHFEGRDVWGDDFVIRFDNGRWELMHNNALEFKAGAVYEEDPLVQLFRRLITENPNGGRWTYNQLLTMGLDQLGHQPFIDGKDCANKLTDGLATDLRQRDGILVEWGVAVKHGRGIKLMQVKPSTSFQTVVSFDEEGEKRGQKVSSVPSVPSVSSVLPPDNNEDEGDE